MWTEKDKKPIGLYLVLTFMIAWGFEGVLILGERFGILTGDIGVVITFLIIGFGAGFAPTYAIYIVLKKHQKIKNIKDFTKLLLQTKNITRTLLIMLIFYGSQLMVYVITNKYLGEPWYLFILYIPLMVIGGGMEETGWRGFLQPALEEKFSFTTSSFITGIIWACWHIPLWFIQGANQSSMNFLAFFLQCIALSFILGLLYKLTKSVLAVILLHAWSNTLGGMFTLDILIKQPDMKLIIIYSIEIIIT
ncbi:MAG: CPBP family intramembrane glutamic endopeptidase, partial [Coprobacillaceae bacterium]